MTSQLRELALGPAAAAFLAGMLDGRRRAKIIAKIKTLPEFPYQKGCKKLVNVKDGNNPVWRIRSGDYRILYLVRDTEILIIDIDHRKSVYR